MTVETILEDDRWIEAGLPVLAERAARAALAHLSLDADSFEIGLLGCDDARIAGLNADFRRKAAPTNVLSWPAQTRAPARPGDPPPPPGPGDGPDLGDIALAYETCAREATALERGLDEHVLHLVIHGTLHLLGYDHETRQDAALMEGLETEILVSLGVGDPYS